MTKKKDDLDLAIKVGISGTDDASNPGINIVDDYLRREKRENFLASLIYVKPSKRTRTEVEVQIWLYDKHLEALNDERWEVLQAKKNANVEPEYDLDYQDLFVPPTAVTVKM